MPHHPTRRGRRRSAPPTRPLRAFRRGVRAAGLRAHVSPTGRPGTPPRAWLRVRACGSRPPHAGARVRACGSQASRCWRSRARLRQPLRVCLRPRRSATALRPSASGTALGPHAPAVCLRRRAQPARSVAPGLSRLTCSARYAPRHSRPIGSTPSAPASAVQTPTGSSGAWGGGAGRGRVPHAGPAPRRHPRRRLAGRAARPHGPRPVPSAGGPHADEGRRPRWRPIPTPPRTTCGGTPRASRARRRPPPCPGASRPRCPARSSRRRSPRRRPRREGSRP